MPDDLPLTPNEQQDWRRTLELANYANILCHCRTCDREWVVSAPEPCICGSREIEAIACWQFPDD